MQQKFSVLVTGNLGYIGPVLVSRLKLAGYNVIGLDVGLYRQTSLVPMSEPHRQIFKDIRTINVSDLEGVDGIIHLAGLSNDPLGELNPALTEDINYSATVKLAELAKSLKIQKFVFASSQSLYGQVDSSIEATEDNADIVNPITSYAKTKWACECALRELADEYFCPVFLRPATVFGSAPNLRVDIVYNSLVASAFTTGKIEMKSDGSPWRPIVHVWDVCSAFMLALKADKDEVSCQAYNVGLLNKNYRIKEMADAVKSLLPETDVVYTGEHGADQRTYRVSFEKIYEAFDGQFRPVFDLMSGGAELLLNMMRWNFTEEQFRGAECNRLVALKEQLDTRKLDNNLFYRG